jgi:hypothetical protein
VSEMNAPVEPPGADAADEVRQQPFQNLRELLRKQ